MKENIHSMNDTPKQSSTQPWSVDARTWVALLTLLAFALRSYGFWWGKPYDFHNDEAFVIVHTIKMLRHVKAGGLPDPETMIYGVWPFYQLGLVGEVIRAAVDALGHMLGIERNIPLMYVGRLMSALYGTLGTVALYVLGKRMFDRSTGLWAAAFWAVMPLSVRDSHFATVDIQFSVWLILTYIALLNIAKRVNTRDYAWAAVMMGLALATRLSALPIFGVFFIAMVVQRWKSERIDSSLLDALLRTLKSPALYGTVLTAVFLWAFLSIPVLDDLPAHLAGDTNSDLNVQGLVARGEIRPLYTIQFELTRPYIYHLRHLFPWAMTWPLALLAYAGWVYSTWKLFRGNRMDVLLAAWTLPYFITVGGWYVKFFRYIIPLLPFMALYAARLIVHARSLSQSNAVNRMRQGVAVIIFLGAFVFSIAYLHIYSRPDTRLQTLMWIKKYIPPHSTIMLEFDASNKFAIHPEWYGLDQYQLRVLNHYEVNGKVGKFWQMPPVSPEEKWEYMIQTLDRADYVVISEAWARVFPKLPNRFPAEATFYQKLFDGRLGYRLVAVFQECPQIGPLRFCDENAEMSWRYFDHPIMYIFQRQAP